MGMDAERLNSGGWGYAFTTTIAKGLLLKMGAADNSLVVTTATSEEIISVTTEAVVSGDVSKCPLPGDVVMAKAGGTVTRGLRQMFVTGGKCTDVSGAVRTAGIALASAVDGDTFPLLFQPLPVGTL